MSNNVISTYLNTPVCETPVSNSTGLYMAMSVSERPPRWARHVYQHNDNFLQNGLFNRSLIMGKRRPKAMIQWYSQEIIEGVSCKTLFMGNNIGRRHNIKPDSKAHIVRVYFVSVNWPFGCFSRSSQFSELSQWYNKETHCDLIDWTEGQGYVTIFGSKYFSNE